MIVTAETTSGYSYKGVLDSVDRHMNIKLKDAEVARVRKLEYRQDTTTSSSAASSSSIVISTSGGGDGSKLVREYMSKPSSESVHLRGEHILFLTLPSSLEADIKETTKAIKKQLVDDSRKKKLEIRQNQLERAKQKQREADPKKAKETMEKVRALNKKVKMAARKTKKNVK
eukprot:TRINITY_DN39163_c0_g1_i2.p1 TRINITY_DN39163_c0_g1~~TRINITY_DN39163_c0_g1_i2.p1  ORF type:complete len:172 (+),score=19.11 TRINITY_DN39163_c0_g1_i2:201-716(+)